MRIDVHEHVEIAGRSALTARRALAPKTDRLSVGDAFRNFHFDVTAVHGQVHRVSEDRIAEIDHKLGIDVRAAYRNFFESAGAAAEQIRKNIREIGCGRAARASPSATTSPTPAHELREIEAGKRIRPSAAKREGLGAQSVVLRALLLIAEHCVGLGDLFEFVLRFLVAFVFVGVMLLRQRPIRLLDLLLGGVLLDAEDLVVIFFGHGRGKYSGHEICFAASGVESSVRCTARSRVATFSR